MNNSKALFIALITTTVFASPTKEMNSAFRSLVDLIPYLNSSAEFSEKKNEKEIQEKLENLQLSFKKAKHENLLKQDIFAPSYALIDDYLAGSVDAFKKGKKTYTHWRLKEITSLCIDCHTRMPTSYPPSFRPEHYTIETTQLNDKYDIGLAQLVVRRYSDARKNFIADIDSKIKAKDDKNLEKSFKQILLIDLKVNRDALATKSLLASYLNQKTIPAPTKIVLKEWQQGVEKLIAKKTLLTGIKDDKELNQFIQKELIPLQKTEAYDNVHDIELLASSGLLSNYLFENQATPQASTLNYWLGWIEKRLKRENFFSSGDLFLKQCIKRYSKDPVAKKCLEEYQESIEFEFSGSSGSHIPEEILQELKELKQLINKT